MFAFLSGFIEADGHFSLISTEKRGERDMGIIFKLSHLRKFSNIVHLGFPQH